jgi:hypothetical protein
MDSSMEKPDLIANQAVCFNCGKILTSNDQYDMVVCLCGSMAVDGGNNLRIIELKDNPNCTRGLSASAKAVFISTSILNEIKK